MAGHRGVDLACSSKILAPADGTVFFVGKVARVPVVSIMHAGGIRTTYLPVESDLKKGTTVKQGDVIGILTPTPQDSVLHWGAIKGDYVNPLRFVYTRVRIKPWGGPR